MRESYFIMLSKDIFNISLISAQLQTFGVRVIKLCDINKVNL